MQDQHCSVI